MLDQRGQAWSGPPLGVEAVLPRLVAHPSEDDPLLGGRERGRTAQDGAGAQPLCAGSLEAGEPTPNRSGIGFKELSDLLGGVSFEDATDGEEPSMFQFLR